MIERHILHMIMRRRYLQYKEPSSTLMRRLVGAILGVKFARENSKKKRKKEYTCEVRNRTSKLNTLPQGKKKPFGAKHITQIIINTRDTCRIPQLQCHKSFHPKQHPNEALTRNKKGSQPPYFKTTLHSLC